MPQSTEPDAAAQPLSESDAQTWSAFAHLGGVVGFLPALAIWTFFRKRSERVATEATEALGWQLTWLPIYLVIAIIGVFGTMLAGTFGWYLFTAILWILYLLNVVLSFTAFVKVNGGGSFRYPVNFRWVKHRLL
jgi:uncharacterized protein